MSSQTDQSATTNPQNRAIVVGGGLVGAMAAIYLSNQPHFRQLFPDGIDVYERRGDSREEQVEAGRSINLAVSSRAFRSMTQLGKLGEEMVQEIQSRGCPMYGRCIHMVSENSSGQRVSSTRIQPYGRPDQYILSTDRRWLNEYLMSIAERQPGVRFHFHHRVQRLKLAEKDAPKDKKIVSIQFKIDNQDQDSVETSARMVFGCDGAFSAVRTAMQQNPKVRMTYYNDFITHGYKELNISATSDGEFALRNDCLHIWPREKYMLIALPNKATRDFTVTLFAPYDTEPFSFEELDKSEDRIVEFFKKEFPDAFEVIGREKLLADWHHNPMSTLSTVRCEPWHFDDQVVLLGDAAHAIIPFYGQGVNAGFEDCRVLDDIFQDMVQGQGRPVAQALAEFSKQRKPSADAIRYFSYENFHEMSASTASTAFLITKKIELMLHKLLPNFYLPLYSMVSFSPDLPYSEVYRIHLRRQKMFGRIGKGLTLAAGALGAYLLVDKVLPRANTWFGNQPVFQDLLSKLHLKQ